MPSTIIQEFIQSLDEEIEAIKRGKGGSIVKIFNGRFLRQMSGLFVYIFNLENFLTILDESPAEIEIRRNRYPAQVLLTQNLEVEIGIEHFCGQFIPEAKLQTNLWYLLELLKKKFIECQSGSTKVDFRLSEILFSGHQSEFKSVTDIIVCENCGTKNRIKKHEPNKIPICGKCETAIGGHTEIHYSSSKDPPNDGQKQAIKDSFSSQISVIWGPPGTGKTKTIAQAIEAHLNAGRRVLLLSHINNAVDEALEKVAEQLKPTAFYTEGKLVRLGKPQEEHLKRMERDYELVLLDKIAEKLGESLTKEKNSLESKKAQLEDVLALYGTALQAIKSSRALSSELNALYSDTSESTRRLASVNKELSRLEEAQIRNRDKLTEAKLAGTIKRIFKGLDPQKIQREIDQTSVTIDSKRRLAREMNARLDELKNSSLTKEREANRAKTEADILLKRLGVSVEELESKKKEFDQRKDVLLARIAEINRQLDEIQKKVLSEAKLVATTLTKTFVAKQFPDMPFDVLILDEASMAPLPHLYWATSRCREFITIVGDFLQLPPICIAEKAIAQKWLRRSIFTVLGIDSVKEACSDPRVKLLDTQYRMVPEISVIPNRFFYQNKLKDHPSTFNRRLDDGVSESSLVLVETAAINPWCSRLSTGGRFNLYNALVCATLAKRTIGRISNGRIGIVAPYAAQARLINKIAKDWELLDRVRISTVHRFQGGEEDIIIFDSVEGPGTKVAPMLDDTKVGSEAEKVLNVAFTRAKNRLYLVAHTKHLISDLHPDSALARIVHYFYQEAEVLGSESLVDNYFTTDFEKWAEALLSPIAPMRKPVSGDFYTERNFWAQFFQDLKTVKERLILLSPFVSVRRSGVLMDYFRAMRERGMDIRIYTRPRNQQIGEMANQADVVIEQLRSIGATVIERRNMHQKVAILDNAIVWEGSLNILSHRDTGEQMRRFEGESGIEEIIRNLELDEENAAGNITDEKCSKCGMPMVVRKSKYGTFLSCSTYPKCDGKIDIRKRKPSIVQRVCPECGKPMVIRRSPKGAFLGCSGYPSCKKTMRL